MVIYAQEETAQLRQHVLKFAEMATGLQMRHATMITQMTETDAAPLAQSKIPTFALELLERQVFASKIEVTASSMDSRHEMTAIMTILQTVWLIAQEPLWDTTALEEILQAQVSALKNEEMGI